MTGCPRRTAARQRSPAILETCPSGEDIFFLFSTCTSTVLARLRPAGARRDRRQPHARCWR